MLTPTGYPPPNTEADMAHSTHSTQPALRGHTALPPGQKTNPRHGCAPPVGRASRSQVADDFDY